MTSARSVAQQVATYQSDWQRKYRELMWSLHTPVVSRGVQALPYLQQSEEFGELPQPPNVRIVFLLNTYEKGSKIALQRELVAEGVRFHDISGQQPLRNETLPVILSDIPGLKHHFWMSELEKSKRSLLAATFLQEQDDFSFVWTVDADGR